MNTIELTPSEFELIKLKREQEDLLEKQLKIKKEIALEKEIIKKEAIISKYQEKDSQQINSTNFFAEKLGKNYEIILRKYDQQMVIEGDYINKLNPSEENYKRHIIWIKTFERISAKIKYDNYHIDVEEFITYSTYGKVKENKGYRMYVSGPGISSNRRSYINIKKVSDLIENAINKINNEKQLEEKKKGALQITVDKMKTLYPNANIITGYDYERNNYMKRAFGDRYDTVAICFENGLSIKYRIYSDASLGRLSINFPSNIKDSWSLMELLSQINFNN
jgi:hypothetical protein